jgi:hypothetical protein
MSLPRSIPSRGWAQDVPEGDEEADTHAIPIPSAPYGSYGALAGSMHSRSAGRLAVSDTADCCAASATVAATLVAVRQCCGACNSNAHSHSCFRLPTWIGILFNWQQPLQSCRQALQQCGTLSCSVAHRCMAALTHNLFEQFGLL